MIRRGNKLLSDPLCFRLVFIWSIAPFAWFDSKLGFLLWPFINQLSGQLTCTLTNLVFPGTQLRSEQSSAWTGPKGFDWLRRLRNSGLSCFSLLLLLVLFVFLKNAKENCGSSNSRFTNACVWNLNLCSEFYPLVMKFGGWRQVQC